MSDPTDGDDQDDSTERATPQIRSRTRSEWDDDRRATDHAEWRARRARRDAPPLGVPVPDYGDPTPDFNADRDEREITRPEAIFERGLTDEERLNLGKTGRDPDSPAPFGQLFKVGARLHQLEQRRARSDTEQRRRDRVLANELLAVREAVSPDHIQKLDARLSSTETTLRGARRIMIAGILAAAGSLGGVGKVVLDSAGQRGGDAVRLQQLERAVDRLQGAIDQLRLEIGRHTLLDTPDAADRVGLLVSPAQGASVLGALAPISLSSKGPTQ